LNTPQGKYDNVRIGVNSRLDTVQATILDVKLSAFINHELKDVNLLYQKYNRRLKNVVDIPIIPKGYLSSFAQYTIKLNSQSQRDGLKTFLANKGIPSMIYYTKTMHNQTAFKDLDNSDIDYPVSTNLCKTVLSLPMHPYLTDKEIDLVCSSIIDYLKG